MTSGSWECLRRSLNRGEEMPLETNNITLGAFSESQAKEVCNWVYTGIYSVYNVLPWEVFVANHWQLADEGARKEIFHAILLDGEFIGFGRIQEVEDRIDLGIGLNPEYCGKGLGPAVMQALVNKAMSLFPNKTIGLEVRQFNERAIKCYEKVGFKLVSKYMKETINGYVQFALMLKI